MRARGNRIAVVVAGLAILAGTHLAPASAEGSTTVVFAGSATVTGGLGYPCMNTIMPTVTVPDLTPTKGQKTCPPQVAPGNPTNKKAKPVEVNGDTRTGTFASTICAAAGVTAGKGSKAPADFGTCVIGSTFVVTGYCGLSQGEGRGAISIDNGLGPNQTYGFHYFWFQAGTLFTVRGQAWQAWPGTVFTKPATPEWSFTGVARTYLDAFHIGMQTSCTNKTGQFFYFEGVADLVHPNPSTLP